MAQVVAAEKITLYDLEQSFGLQQTQDKLFFPEWQENLPELVKAERHRLERVQLVIFEVTVSERSLLRSFATVYLETRS